MEVKCPQCGQMVDSEPAISEQYRKIIKCTGRKRRKLKTKEITENCGYTGFVKIERKTNAY